jgi:tetratricopeptide (TPR) repeat protein
MPTPPIFISYAHDTAAADARALKAELGDLAFLDESGVATREDFNQRIASVLMESKAAVIFADQRHDQRPFCRWERAMILAPKTLDHVFLLEPAAAKLHLDAYPPDLRGRNWNVKADDLRQAIENAKPLRELIGPEWRFLLAEQMELTDVPAPKTVQLAAIPHYGFAVAGSLNQRFVGRGDRLAELDRHLRGNFGATVALTTALTAAGGFGKTRMALEYAYRYAPEHFTGGVFWVRCEDRLETQFWEMLNVLNRTPARPINEVDFASIPGLLAERVGQQVAQSKPVLFVLDNVPEAGSGPVAPQALDRFCPPLGTVSVIITTRQQDQAADHTLEVGALDEMSASLLLTNQFPNRTSLSYTEWDEVTDWVGRLPIALEMLNKALRANAIRMADLLVRARSKDMTKELDELAQALGLPRGVTQTFEISYQVLSASAQRAARCLAQLGPEPIPEPLFEAFGSEVDTPSNRVELTRHSWLTAEPELQGFTYFGSIHRVLGSYLRSKCTAAGDEFERASGAASAIFELKYDFRNPRNWPLLNAVRPHALVLMGRTEETAARIGGWLGALASVQGDLWGARKLAEGSLEIRRRAVGAEHPETLKLEGNLTIMIREQGDLTEARKRQEALLEVSRRVLGAEHGDTLTAMNNLAVTMLQQGDLARARAIQEQALEIYRRVSGPEDPASLTLMSNLASTMQDQGHLAEAREIHKEVLDIRRRLLGDEDPKTLISMNNLADVMYAQRDFKGAMQIQAEVLVIRRRVLGPEHPYTLMSMSNLADAACAMGDLAGSRALEEHVLSVRLRVLGAQHPDTYTSVIGLLKTLERQKDQKAAGELFRRYLRPILDGDPNDLPAALRTQLPEIRNRLTRYGG